MEVCVQLHTQATVLPERTLVPVELQAWKYLKNLKLSWLHGNFFSFVRITGQFSHTYTTAVKFIVIVTRYLMKYISEKKTNKKMWAVTLLPWGKEKVLEFERGSTKSPFLENSLWKRRDTAYAMHAWKIGDSVFRFNLFLISWRIL